MQFVEKSLLIALYLSQVLCKKNRLLTFELFFLPHICLNKDIRKLQEGKFSSIKINSKIMEYKLKEKN